jgi:hypothetical protein
VDDQVYVEAVAGRIDLKAVPQVVGSGIVALAEVMGLGSVDSEEALRRIVFALDLDPNSGPADAEACLLSRGEIDFALILNPTIESGP